MTPFWQTTQHFVSGGITQQLWCQCWSYVFF
jgi:hypothetical protein